MEMIKMAEEKRKGQKNYRGWRIRKLKVIERGRGR